MDGFSSEFSIGYVIPFSMFFHESDLLADPNAASWCLIYETRMPLPIYNHVSTIPRARK